MSQDVSSVEWIRELPEEECRELIAKTRKRFFIFLLISIIPIVNFVTMGCAIFCYNNWYLLKTRGRSTGYEGSTFLRLFLVIYAYIVPLLMVLNLCVKNESIGSKVLGW